ncbi:MAG TPA: NAD(P)-dependent oxidoreductase [Limnochordia bacterium]
MQSAIVVHPRFDGEWPFAADHFRSLWEREGPVAFVRLAADDPRPLGAILSRPDRVVRLVALGVPIEEGCLDRFTALEEAAFWPPLPLERAARLERAGVTLYHHTSEGFWGQSVAEMALGLTIAALRRIPQLHRAILTDLSPWSYAPPGGVGQPGARGGQFGDDPRFAHGTVAGKRVRIVGAGNVGSRYASFVRTLGADVKIWDPFASEPCFHRAGARREWHLDALVKDADIFAPMLPLRESTRGLIRREHIDALPRGCLVVLVTRAQICDMSALRRRVLADELSLAADVFDAEPLPLDDPLLGRPNVVHTPHVAGRTRDANHAWAQDLAARFRPRLG